ncbi:hypothetical protein [Streptomyces sp. S186]|uniref:hypothetical protein n=1 Tax=Streptomyces sp. S186 TaxID=3434395 RepID=UPI003F66CD1E
MILSSFLSTLKTTVDRPWKSSTSHGNSRKTAAEITRQGFAESSHQRPGNAQDTVDAMTDAMKEVRSADD